MKRHVKVAAKKGRERLERAEMEVVLAPVRYAFAEDITVFQREMGNSDKGGWTVTPHWRKGHWRFPLTPMRVRLFQFGSWSNTRGPAS